MEATTTRRPEEHHLPLIPGAGPGGSASGGRTSPPFPRRPSERDRQRSTWAPIRQQTVHPARLPPSSQVHLPVRRQEDGTPRTRGQGDPQRTSRPYRGWEDEPLKAPPLHTGPDSTSPGHGHQPPDQPGQCATGLPILTVTQPNQRDADEAPQQEGHDTGDPGADEEMTETSGPQKSGDPCPPPRPS